jgi:hypothetical protein
VNFDFFMEPPGGENMPESSISQVSTIRGRLRSNLSDPANLNFLAKVGGGVIGNIVARIKNAALTALVEGSPRITADILRRAEARPAMCPLARRNSAP